MSTEELETIYNLPKGSIFDLEWNEIVYTLEHSLENPDGGKMFCLDEALHCIHHPQDNFLGFVRWQSHNQCNGCRTIIDKQQL